MGYNPDPRAPENNRHHTLTYRSAEDWWENEFGYGPFDPDRLSNTGGKPITHNYPLTIVDDKAVIDLTWRPF